MRNKYKREWEDVTGNTHKKVFIALVSFAYLYILEKQFFGTVCDENL